MPTQVIKRVRAARRGGDVGGGVSLRMLRRWFADNDDDTGETPPEPDVDGEEQPEPDDPAKDQDDDGDINALPSWAQNYIKELRNEAAQRRVELKEAEQKRRQREQERLAEQGKWKELAEARQEELQKLTPYQERAEALESMIRESNKERIESIPEDRRGLVPTDYAPEKLSRWLDANTGLLTKPTAPPLDGGAGGEGGQRLPQLTAEEKRIAKRTGISEEKYAKRKAEIEARRQRRDG